MNKESFNILNARLEKLKQLFPELFSEDKNESETNCSNYFCQAEKSNNFG